MSPRATDPQPAGSRAASERPSISVVIPVYHSREMLPELLRRLADSLPAATADYEVVLVDDGSRDGSWDAIRAGAATYPWVRGLSLMRNYGQHNALLCGIRAATKEIIVTIDDDLQHPPEHIPALAAALAPEVDVVYGRPRRERHGLLRRLASRATKLVLQRAMGAGLARQSSPFRAFRTQLRTAFAHYEGAFVSIDVLLTWGTTRFAAVQFDHQERAVGRSNYTLRKLFLHAVNMMTGFTTFPLEIASLLGLLSTLFGIAVLAYVLLRYLSYGSVVPGFPFLASIIAIFSGVQLFALGIMGEYLARMHSRSLDYPQYVVRTTTSPREGGESARPAG
ncbi:MAG: glycosyltransferase family 2 protein [Candidatus Methylomirabilales bacterium]